MKTRDFVKQCVKNNPQISVHDICELYFKKYGIRPTDNAIYYHLQKNREEFEALGRDFSKVHSKPSLTPKTSSSSVIQYVKAAAKLVTISDGKEMLDLLKGLDLDTVKEMVLALEDEGL